VCGCCPLSLIPDYSYSNAVTIISLSPDYLVPGSRARFFLSQAPPFPPPTPPYSSSVPCVVVSSLLFLAVISCQQRFFSSIYLLPTHTRSGLITKLSLARLLSNCTRSSLFRHLAHFTIYMRLLSSSSVLFSFPISPLPPPINTDYNWVYRHAHNSLIIII
jgi:hypothetical protein